ncbi:MAG: ImmA/IrrE family metallo-endopeptidase [Angelakisella sp.]
MAEQAARVLLDAGVDRLPVHLRPIAERCNAVLFTYRQYAEAAGTTLGEVAARFGEDGFTQQVQGQYLIFYREGGSLQRARFTIAHELAHILLGHLQPGRAPAQDCDRMADCLAAELLCPSAVLAACDWRDEKELARLCDISPAAAQCRVHVLARQPVPKKTQTQQKLVNRFEGYLTERQERLPDEPLPRLRSHRI